MSQKPNNQKESKMNDSQDYRLVVYRSEDFREIRSFNLSLSNMYVFTSIVFIMLCAMLFSLLAFTPLKRLIPGYGKITSNQQFLKLVDGVDDLSVQLEAQGTYIGAMRTLLGNGLADPDMGEFAASNIDVPREIAPSNNLPSIPSIEPNGAIVDGRENVGADFGLYETLETIKILKPVGGVISSDFDPTIKHYGVDILAPENSPILSIMDGIVISSGWDLETGYTLGIQHENNILSFYKHNSQLLKEKGTFVRSGEAVAIIGNTGTLSSGPHLHFEIWHSGKPVNPRDILNF